MDDAIAVALRILEDDAPAVKADDLGEQVQHLARDLIELNALPDEVHYLLEKKHFLRAPMGARRVLPHAPPIQLHANPSIAA
ncbi:hypothetical protein GCM10007884_17430 [Methylobacterium brachythecii]|uniref:Uncharacterized protein n=1 Tax=Methylobacterium brachythecii TaxID=1176177 RepID=A0ABQ6D2J1_9HYPH|nr:hypothetical protein GCM10007884_17430 [Methylobacterium brachythecii]